MSSSACCLPVLFRPTTSPPTAVLTVSPPALPPVSRSVDTRLPLRFVRHGATAPNLAGLRCGGDLDVPLTAVGRRQAATVAEHIAGLDPPVKLIVTSDLKRNRETADIIARRLPGVTTLVQPAFSERRLGAWNLKPIAQTQPWFEARQTPPGGESDDEFTRRVADAVRQIKQQLAERPLLVGSKGVGRVLGELIGLAYRLELGNGEIWEFDFAERPCLETAWGAL
jgi:probable phosphoglycerate mutase